jgi:adenosylmethionine-8-amino-7-oxononanoate aminotransferase
LLGGAWTDMTHLRQWDNAHVWHPFTPMQAYRDEQAPIIESGDGFFLVDTAGNRYLDGISSLWCNVHGHRVPQIDQAIRDQLDRIGHSTLLGLSSAASIELAHDLVGRAPAGLKRVFYSDSGATAVEIALKIAYQYQLQKPGATGPRDLFASLGGAYHGDTIGAVSVGAIDVFHRIFGGLLFQTLQVPSPVTYRVPTGHDPDSYLRHCYAELERVIARHHERIAAFVIEPLVQGAAGILVHPMGYLRRVRELTAEYGIPLIADEVAVGFGRTGTLFACQQEDVRPDLLCLAKGITGGYLPLAATLVTDQIYEAFLGDPAADRTFFHGHTYTGNPLGCAAALASLRLLGENRVLDNVRANEARLRQRLSELRDHPHVGEIRHKGIMVGIELVQDRATKRSFPPERRTGHRVTLAARRRGVIIRPLGDVVVLMPAPAMPGELLDRLCEAAFAAIEDATTTG